MGYRTARRIVAAAALALPFALGACDVLDDDDIVGDYELVEANEEGLPMVLFDEIVDGSFIEYELVDGTLDIQSDGDYEAVFDFDVYADGELGGFFTLRLRGEWDESGGNIDFFDNEAVVLGDVEPVQDLDGDFNSDEIVLFWDPDEFVFVK